MKHNIEEDPAFKKYPPVTMYDPEHADDFEAFKSIDRIRLMSMSIKDQLNITALIQSGLVISFFPLHEEEPLKKLEGELLRIPTPVVDLPIDSIRNYYGE